MKSNHVWIIAVIIAFITGGFLLGKGNQESLFPLLIVLLCPLMMLFMMGGHKHK